MGKGDYEYPLTGKNFQFAIMDELHTYRSDKFYDVVKATTSKKEPIKPYKLKRPLCDDQMKSWAFLPQTVCDDIIRKLLDYHDVYVNPGRCDGLCKYLMNEGEKDMHIGSKGISVNYDGHKYWAREVEFDYHDRSPWKKVHILLDPSPAFLVDELYIKNVIFNPPATIVFWSDGDKTVVQCRGEEFDPEKGLAMAISRKFLGNKFEYYNTFKHWLKRAPKEE